jgi:hypothetical protein
MPEEIPHRKRVAEEELGGRHGPLACGPKAEDVEQAMARLDGDMVAFERGDAAGLAADTFG